MRLGDQEWPPALGLPYGEVRLTAGASTEWALGYERIAAAIRDALGDAASSVEHVGSTAVPGLPAKPIVDIAVGMRPDETAVVPLRARLEPRGLIYRGDLGSQGGVLFVLESAPRHRIAHVHVVAYGDESWVRYLAFRDRLRRDPAARESYARLKQTLAERFPGDRAAYTAGKDRFVSAMLSGWRTGR